MSGIGKAASKAGKTVLSNAMGGGKGGAGGGTPPFFPMPGMGGGMPMGASKGGYGANPYSMMSGYGILGGLLGRNLAQDDYRREFERMLGIQTADWKDRNTFTTDEKLRYWDEMFPRRDQEFGQNLGHQQQMFDQWLPQQQQIFDQGFGNRGRSFWQDKGFFDVMQDAMRGHRDKDAWQGLKFRGEGMDQDRVHRGRDFWQEMGHDKALRNRDLKYDRTWFDQRLGQQGRLDDRSWGNWDTGLDKLGGLTQALGLN